MVQVGVFQADCPRCGTKKSGFRIAGEEQVSSTAHGYLWDTLAICGQCDRGIVASLLETQGQPPSKLLVRGGRSYLSIFAIEPQEPDTSAPKHTPDNVAKFYTQAIENISNNWDAAGAMLRKTLDTGLKAKFPQLSGTLFKRIEDAKKNGELTKELADWAHQIRLEGNDAVHDEDPYTREEVEHLRTFTELVLRYLFTLPGMLVEAQTNEEE